MHPYIQILKSQLSQTMPYYGEEDVNSVLEMLYSVYREKQCSDPQEVKDCFAQLDEVLCKLTLREYDKVWNAACGLCSVAEKVAFLEGIRVAQPLRQSLECKKTAGNTPGGFFGPCPSRRKENEEAVDQLPRARNSAGSMGSS